MKKYLAILILLVAGAVAAQDGDQWFVLDKFSGLNLYSEKTNLQQGEALLAQNIQFRKPGTVSVLDGLRKRDSLAGTDKILGIGSLHGLTLDSARIMIARDTFLFATPTTTIGFVPAKAQDPSAAWVYASGSRLVQDTSDRGRAAEFYRPGWGWNSWNGATLNTTKRIDYISDNNTFYLTDSSQLTDTGINALIWPFVPNHDARVRFIPVEINGSMKLLILQSGMEPMLSDGTTQGTRYFGVADSGVVDQMGVIVNDSGVNVCISDPNKIGVFEDYTLGPDDSLGGDFWLHIPFGYIETDTLSWGRIFKIDSNVTTALGDTVSHWLWFHMGTRWSEMPESLLTRWHDSILGTRYQIISAPFVRDVLTESQTPTADIISSGQVVRFPTGGLVSQRQFGHIPHMLTFRDTPDSLIYRFPNGFGDINEYRYPYVARGSDGLPIRLSYNDTVGTDTTYIRTSAFNVTFKKGGSASFTTSDWAIYKLSVPYASDGIVYVNRLYLAGDPLDPNFICYSEPFRIGKFPTTNFISVGGNGDAFTGFAKIYDWLVIFQSEHTWLLKGDPDLGGVLELALPDEGCIAPSSILEIENQVIYLSEKGWRVFDGNTAKDFALPIKPAVQAQPRVEYRVNQAHKRKSASTYDPTTGNVWLCMPFSTDTANSGSFLYNYIDGSFTYSDEVYGDNAVTFPFNDTLITVFTNAGLFFTYGYTDSLDATGIDRDSMQAIWSSGWMDFGHPEQYKYVDQGIYHATVSSPASAIGNTRLYCRFYRDFDTTAFFTDSLNVVGIVGGKHYEVECSVQLKPQADSSELQYLRVAFVGDGLNVMEIRRVALRYRVAGDLIGDVTKAIRP